MYFIQHWFIYRPSDSTESFIHNQQINSGFLLLKMRRAPNHVTNDVESPHLIFYRDKRSRIDCPFNIS